MTVTLAAAWMLAAAVNLTSLEHSKWKSIGAGNPPFTLTLEKDSFVFSGCNSVSGKLLLEPSRISFLEPAQSTRKACPDNSDTFIKLVGASPKVKLEGDRLTLTAGSTWVFQREPLPSKEAKTKFIYVAAITKQQKCLQIRESKDQPWTLNCTPVIGFEPVPGIEYRLRIKEDSPPLRWYLDMVVEQKVTH